MARVKWLAEEPIDEERLLPEPPRRYGYAMIKIHSISQPRYGELEFEASIVNRILTEAILTERDERQLFAHWMRQSMMGNWGFYSYGTTDF